MRKAPQNLDNEIHVQRFFLICKGNTFYLYCKECALSQAKFWSRKTFCIWSYNMTSVKLQQTLLLLSSPLSRMLDI